MHLGKDTKDGLSGLISQYHASHLRHSPAAAHLACFCSYWWTCACWPTGVHRVGWEGAFWLHCASWWLFFPSLLCLLLVVTKFGCPCWRGNFCFWTTEFFICSDQISCKKEEANKWSICMPCSATVLSCGLEGTRALFLLLPFGCVTLLFRRAVHLLFASGYALRLACSRCLNMHVC